MQALTPQLYLMTPDGAGPDFAEPLAGVLAAVPAAAVRIRRGEMADGAYSALARALVPVIQDAGAAAVIDGTPELVRELGADGLHVLDGPKAVKHAISVLKPDLIVGAGAMSGRHDAMVIGESGADYLMFGETGSPEAFELAAWWIENFQIPAVWCLDTDGTLPDPAPEFVAPGSEFWAAPEGPAKRLAAIATSLAEASRKGAA